MSELLFYQTERDELETIDSCFEDGCSIVPDVDYEEPRAVLLKSLSEYNSWRGITRHFFILHERFQQYPLCIRPIEKHGKTVYYVSPTQGGPFLEMLGGGIITDSKDSGQRIIPGFLSCPPRYWNADVTVSIKSPPELADTYKRLCRIVRRSGTRIRPDNSIYWVGPDAKAQLMNGAKLSLHEDWSLPNA